MKQDIVMARTIGHMVTNDSRDTTEYVEGAVKETVINNYIEDAQSYMCDIIENYPQHKKLCRKYKVNKDYLFNEDVEWIEDEMKELKEKLEVVDNLRAMDRIFVEFQNNFIFDK